MKKWWSILFLNLFFTSQAFPTRFHTIEVNVPFLEKTIHPHQTIIIHYDNKSAWDGVVCGCSSQKECSTYTAQWQFKNQTRTSNGPNSYTKLILNFGLAPEAPPQDADLKGKIKLINTGVQPIPISCDFEFSS